MSHEADEITPKVRTVGSELADGYTRFAHQPFRSRALTSGIVGGIYGALSSDQKNESLIGTVMDVGMGGAVAIGAESAASYVVRNHGTQIKEFLDNGKAVNTGDLTKIATEVDADKMVAKMNKAAGRAAFGAKGVGLFIGATALIGVSHKLHRNAEVQRMQNDAETAMAMRKKQDDKAMNQLFGYDKHQQMGQLAIDMWKDRMGHHKMGNAKFQ